MYFKISKLNKVILSFIFTINVIFNANATDISALSFNGDLLGKVIPDGAVINADNEIIGHITADGYVINDKKDVIGGIVPQGVAISYNNSILGKVNNDGTVTAENDTLIGKVLPQGIVVNDNYDILGSVISQGLVFNDSGKIIGRVSGDGYFYSLKGDSNGVATSNGYIYIPSKDDNKLELSGRLMLSKIVVSFNGKFLGSVAPDGKVFDLNKNVVGNLYANGYIYDKDKKAIGHIVNSGYAFDFNGNYLGVISYNGDVIDKGTTTSFAVNEDRIVDKSGNIIGFRVEFNATATALDGSFLGYLIPNGVIVKGRNVVGKINASGDVVDKEGKQIGFISKQGPIFDYLGKVRANASVGGKVVSLDGLEQGYMLKDRAFDYKGREIGKTLSTRLIFDKANKYLGVSGINSQLDKNAEIYTISPYGYVFNQAGEISGHSIGFSSVYSPEGNILTYTSVKGDSENSSLNEISKLDANGVLIDKNNKILGKTNTPIYATNFMGDNLGYITPINTIIDNKNNRISKILPNNSIIDLEGNIIFNQQSGNDFFSISINGDFLGANLFRGNVENNKQTLGKIGSDKYVMDNLGALYGTTLPFATAVTKDCKYLGVVSNNGEIRNAQNTYIGTVLSNDQVLNDREEIIGHIISSSIITNDKGEVLGTSNSLGDVLNYQNQVLGCQDKRGFIKNSQGENIGRTVKFATVMGLDNKIIGYTDISGRILDISGVQLASTNIYGDVISKDGKKLGILFNYSIAFDNNNIYLGRVDINGNIIADNGNIIGSVNVNGEAQTLDGKKGYALYDLYVYDNQDNTIGYIAKNGKVYSIMGDVVGTIYNGFVLDKRQNVVARGYRDYTLKDKNNKSIGYLKLDGSVVNNKNIKVGTLDNNGNILDNANNVIAIAHYLQYYQHPAHPSSSKQGNNRADSKSSQEQELQNQYDEYDNLNDIDNTLKDGNVNSKSNQEKNNLLPTSKDKGSINNEYKESEKSQLEGAYESNNYVGQNQKLGQENNNGENNKDISSSDNQQALTKEDKEVMETKLNHKAIGIAITPGGKYIGDVYENNVVISEDGKIVGRQTENGQIIDEEGNTIGNIEQRKNRKKTPANDNWWHNVASGATISPHSSKNDITNVGPGGGVGPGGRYNPQRAAILSQYHQQRREKLTSAKIESGFNASSIDGWQNDWGIGRQVSTLRVDMSNVITADKPIPAVLARSLISLGSAPVTAIVERNVYGDSGRNVIIPAGSRVIGGLQDIGERSRFDGASGGTKIEISWSRIIRPDGVSFFINSAQTGDSQGRGGGALGYVDEQLVKKYTLPIVGTMVTSAITYMMAADEESSSNAQVENSKQQAASDAREQFMSKMDEILQEIIDKKKEIAAVTYVPAGTRIIIYPMSDLWLRSAKDVEEGVESTGRRNVENVLIDEDGSSSVKSTTTGNNQQRVVMGNQQNTQNQPQHTPLIAEETPQNNNQRNQNRPIRALPPPSTDGSAIVMPQEEDEEDAGEIDLNF